MGPPASQVHARRAREIRSTRVDGEPRRGHRRRQGLTAGKSYGHRAVYLFLMRQRFMLLPNRLLRAALTTAMALLAGACASVDVGGAAGPSVPAPQYRLGHKRV